MGIFARGDIAVPLEIVLGAIVLICINSYRRDYNRYPQFTSSWMLVLSLASLLEILADLTCYAVDAFDLPEVSKMIVFALSYIFLNACTWAFARFALSRSEKPYKIATLSVDFVTLAMSVVTVALAPTGIIYSLADVGIITGDSYWLTWIAPIYCVVVAGVITFKIPDPDFLWRNSTLTLLALTLGGSFLQILVPYLPLTSSAIVIGLLSVMLNAHTGILIESARKDVAIAQAQIQLADERSAMMLSQIKPHFIQNSLMAIAYLCGTEPMRAKALTLEFAKYLRGNIVSLENTGPAPFSVELDHTRAYIALEQARFGERLQVNFDIQDEDFLVPPLSIQPIVENAIKHGISQQVDGGTVTISTACHDGYHWVLVEDNGMGFDPDASPVDNRVHVGVSNARMRLETLCHGTLDIASKPGNGTIATIKIPSNDKELGQ